MNVRWVRLGLPLLLCASGCTEQSAPQPPSARPAADDPAPALGVVSLVEEASPWPTESEAIVEEASAEVFEPAPSTPDLVLRPHEQDPSDLARWAGDAEAQEDVRITSLRRLEGAVPEQAMTAAEALLTAPGSSTLLRSNAVAVLARSDDPRAEELIAGLEPRYQRLVHALRRREGHE